MIKIKPIASYRVDIYTKQTLRDWFETEYRPTLEATGIQYGKFIYNIDEKRARVYILTGEDIIIPIRIKEIYIGILENRLSVTIIESISADRRAILLVIIIPGVIIIISWFSDNMTGHELFIISESGYTNKSICMVWLDYFIKYNNCKPNKE
jgi:hypothetical protein